MKKLFESLLLSLLLLMPQSAFSQDKPVIEWAKIPGGTFFMESDFINGPAVLQCCSHWFRIPWKSFNVTGFESLGFASFNCQSFRSLFNDY